MKLSSITLLLGSITLLACQHTKVLSDRENAGGSESEHLRTGPEMNHGKYRGSYTRYFDLENTRLDITPDWKRKELEGTATLRLHPHFYATDSLVLDAKKMFLHEVAWLDSSGITPLKFDYDSSRIVLHLPKKVTRQESITVRIRYTSRPDAVTNKGSAAIRDRKGLYFINADGTDPDKPVQVWTQGETESNSVWFPTIESPAQRMTQEISITVDTPFQTLSNGLLTGSEIHPDGTRTDHWKQSLPAAPYLTVFAAGKWSIVKDKWRNLDVSYYIDPPYANYASMIFGHTPEMMEYFSNLLKTDFPWEKYDQVVVHDYISGAMENTTATVHGTNMLQDPCQYMDGNYEDYISHELFHQWFGDLVTCESWSNITLNEGFANYGEYLWREHKYGRDDADRLNQEDLAVYLYYKTHNDPPLIRYYYNDREDVYDAISYNKGGRVLHMLRKYTGDDAFFAALHLYLKRNKFSSVEIHNLRLAFEEVTGEDLNWFFNQWFMESGSPVLDIRYNWNDTLHEQKVIIEQQQSPDSVPLYRIPLDIDFYFGNNKVRKRVIADQRTSAFDFTFSSRPDLVNVDAEKMLLCKKNDHKTHGQFRFQFYHAPLYLDRFEAVSNIGSITRPDSADVRLLMDACHDREWKIRTTAIEYLGYPAKNDTGNIRLLLTSLAMHDPSPDVRTEAIKALAKYFSYKDNQGVYLRALKDSSYQTKAAAFDIIALNDTGLAFISAKGLEQDSDNTVIFSLTGFYLNHPEGDHVSYFQKAIRNARSWTKNRVIMNFGKYLAAGDTSRIERGFEILSKYSDRSSSSRGRSACIAALKSIRTTLDNRKEKEEKELATLQTQNPGSPEVLEKESSLNSLTSISMRVVEQISRLEKIQ